MSKEKIEKDRKEIKRQQPEDSNFEREGLMREIDDLEVLFFSSMA
jgi:hypothetical protein